MKKRGDETVTLRVRGSLVGAEALAFAREVATVSLHRYDRIVLSLSKVTAIDASGIAALVRIYSQLALFGKRLELTDLRPEIKDELARTGLGSVLVETEEQYAPVLSLPASDAQLQAR